MAKRDLKALDLDNVLPAGSRRSVSSAPSGRSPSPQASASKPPLSPKGSDDPAKIIDILVSHGYDREDCVQWVSLITASKRKRTSAADSKGHVPSDLTVWKVWKKYTGGPAPVLKCRRPLASAPGIPLVLLHKPFMDFLVDVKEGEPDDGDVKFAWKFWQDVNEDRYVEDHDAAVEAIGAVSMHEYFNWDNPVLSVSHESRVKGIRTDVVHMKGPFYPVIDEFKSQAVAGEPAMQNMDGFRRVWAQVPKGRNGTEYQPYSLLINVRGSCSVEVMAASLQSGEVWAETVTTFACYPTAEGPMEELLHSARVWRAIRLFANGYKPMKKQPAAVPWCLSEFREVQQPDKRKLFFTCKDEQGLVKAAKVCRSYSEAAHRAWQSFAPTLDKVETLPCGWQVAYMEYLAAELGWMSAWDVIKTAREKERVEIVDRLKEHLQLAATAGHAQGFVHGDFRLCNVMVKGLGSEDKDGLYEDYEVRVVDFDWAGKLGEAKFPGLLNESVAWFPHSGYNLPITKEHDSWFLDGEGLSKQFN